VRPRNAPVPYSTLAPWRSLRQRLMRAPARCLPGPFTMPSCPRLLSDPPGLHDPPPAFVFRMPVRSLLALLPYAFSLPSLGQRAR
jgi:hypothetical protein